MILAAIPQEEAMPFLAAAHAYDNSGGAETLADWLDGAETLGVLEGGALVGALALRQDAHGVLWITAAGGRVAGGAVAEVLPAIEAGAKACGLKQVAFQTIRPGLSHLANRAGYSLSCTLRKYLK